MDRRPRIAFVHSLVTHYTARTFELLAERFDVDFLFTAGGGLSYWPAEHGRRLGRFRGEYLEGFGPGSFRLIPALPWRLATRRYDLVVKDITSRFALPVTFGMSQLRGLPFVLWTGIWYRFDTFFHRLAHPLLRTIYRRADALVTYGTHVRDHLVAEGASPDRIFVAPHAVDNALYSRPVDPGEVRGLRARLGLDGSEPVVLSLGRLVPEKGLDGLLRAFARLDAPGAVLVVAGNGPCRPRLEALASSLGLTPRVRFVGHVPSEDCVKYYALATIQVIPSITTRTFREPWGLVVNECFNQGVPVIASDSVGAAAGGLVVDGVNGLVVPERDEAALAVSLARLLRDRDLRDAFSRAAREGIRTWTQERMVDRFADAFEHARRRAR